MLHGHLVSLTSSGFLCCQSDLATAIRCPPDPLAPQPDAQGRTAQPLEEYALQVFTVLHQALIGCKPEQLTAAGAAAGGVLDDSLAVRALDILCNASVLSDHQVAAALVKTLQQQSRAIAGASASTAGTAMAKLMPSGVRGTVSDTRTASTAPMLALCRKSLDIHKRRSSHAFANIALSHLRAAVLETGIDPHTLLASTAQHSTAAYNFT